MIPRRYYPHVESFSFPRRAVSRRAEPTKQTMTNHSFKYASEEQRMKHSWINHRAGSVYSRKYRSMFHLCPWSARKSSKHTGTKRNDEEEDEEEEEEEEEEGGGEGGGEGGTWYIGILYGLEGSSFEVTRTSRPDDREEIEICDDCADEISVSLNGELLPRLVGVPEERDLVASSTGHEDVYRWKSRACRPLFTPFRLLEWRKRGATRWGDREREIEIEIEIEIEREKKEIERNRR